MIISVMKSIARVYKFSYRKEEEEMIYKTLQQINYHNLTVFGEENMKHQLH